MVHWPVHPILIAVVAAVFGLIYLVTRSLAIAGVCAGAVWIAGMAVLQYHRLKPPKASEPNKCYGCDYDLTGLPLHKPHCPECGLIRRYR